MRNFLQDKLNDDHLVSVKTKEKSSVLFNEIVRLGEENSKHNELLNQVTVQYENRI